MYISLGAIHKLRHTLGGGSTKCDIVWQGGDPKFCDITFQK